MNSLDARDREEQLLAQCALAALGVITVASDAREANVFRVAGMLVQSRFPAEAARMLRASDQYLAKHPAEKVEASEVVRRGWVASLPRLKDMLGRRLQEKRRVPMPAKNLFHTETPLAAGLRELMKQLEQRLSLTKPLTVYLAGGMGVHLYTANRVTSDVDAEFGSRVFIPDDLVVEVALEDGSRQLVHVDKNYNSTFALMHEDYQDDAIPVDFGLDFVRVYVLSPVDLAVSKISRFAENDRQDIEALVRAGLASADEIERRARGAVGGYVGGLAMLQLNLRDAVALARSTEEKMVQGEPLSDDDIAEKARRVEALPALRAAGGAAYTFGKRAQAAIEAAGSPDQVNWRQVQRDLVAECLGAHGQAPQSAVDALCKHSPGAVTPREQALVSADVALRGPLFQAQYRKGRARAADRDGGPDPLR